MLPFEFIVDGPPVSQQTRRQERLRSWRATVRQEAERYWSIGEMPTLESIVLRIWYFYEDISVDIDNIVKPIQDALNGLVYIDDDQVTDLIVRKRNLSENFKVINLSGVLAEGFNRENEFLYIVVEQAPDQEVID